MTLLDQLVAPAQRQPEPTPLGCRVATRRYRRPTRVDRERRDKRIAEELRQKREAWAEKSRAERVALIKKAAQLPPGVKVVA